MVGRGLGEGHIEQTHHAYLREVLPKLTASTEALLSEAGGTESLAALRSTHATPAGRAELRERVAIEHSLARISQTQGDRARYLGTRKNLYDLRRHAAIANLYVEMGRAA